MIARIAVEGMIYTIDKPYSYRVPAELRLLPGMRVSVPFGRGNRIREGMVLALESGDDESLKPVSAALDAEPVLSERMLRLAAFVRERYFCTFYDAIRAMLPAGLWLKNRTEWELSELPADWDAKLSSDPAAAGILRLLQEAGGSLSEEALLRLTGSREETLKILTGLRDRRWIRSRTELLKKSADKTEKILHCLADSEQIAEFCAKKRRSAPMQAAVMELMGTVGSVSWKELHYFTGASLQTVNSLERAGLLRVSMQEVLRRTRIVPTDRDVRFALSPEQQPVFDGLKQQMESGSPGAALLFGVTGSGKTAIYINLIRRCLETGRSAMLLVPEIALTPQLLSLLAACFGDQIAVLHSALRVGERYDEYKRIERGDARVIVGTRSAVFAPLQDPGLLILDEEQEHTYKSENTPRYHAREIALYRGSKEGALVLLGSATPSIETMYLAQKGVYRLYRLEHRYNGKDLPAVSIVDMKQELLQGNSSALSRPLVEEIRKRMERKEKTILLLNRRGGNRMVLCVDCGSVPTCPNCSVHLTYHMTNDRLMCHYCGYSAPLMQSCPECGGHLKRIGFGTQQLEYDLNQALPEAKVLRMDADTVTPTNPHETILRKFEKEDISVLIGTQMVAKGLHFDDVTLVGVVDADMSLYIDSFRSSETTFSLITQVVGRSGRGAKRGMALIQTFTPRNEVLLRAAKQDYDGFYDTELPLRKLRCCPPFCDLLQIGFVGFPEAHVEACARQFADALWKALTDSPLRDTVQDLLGPAPAAIMKINQKYRYRLTLCCKNSRPLRQLLGDLVRHFAGQRAFSGVTVFVDINGYE